MSVSAAKKGSDDLSLAMAGGSKFLERMNELSDLLERSNAALAELNLAQSAADTMKVAEARLAAANEYQLKIKTECDAMLSGAKEAADDQRKSAQATSTELLQRAEAKFLDAESKLKEANAEAERIRTSAQTYAAALTDSLASTKIDLETRSAALAQKEMELADAMAAAEAAKAKADAMVARLKDAMGA